jgi:sulfite reductase alpha subunit-like flavoprotein
MLSVRGDVISESFFHPCGREVKSILNSMGKENLRPMGSVDNSGGLELKVFPESHRNRVVEISIC